MTAIVGVVLLALFAIARRKAGVNHSPASKPAFRKLLFNWQERKCDSFGCGHFGASRDGGSRLHKGVDYVALPGDAVFAPFDGAYVRKSKPYDTDERYTGMVFESGPYQVNVFYVNPQIATREVKAGEIVGFVQNLGSKYSGITNHVHVEVTNQGKHENPGPYFVG